MKAEKVVETLESATFRIHRQKYIGMGTLAGYYWFKIVANGAFQSTPQLLHFLEITTK